ncbi:MAG: YqgE/AlgH family protein [Sulfuricella sp.]|nr:YqgE/AlgH family protein [Sulfuricella sp.]
MLNANLTAHFLIAMPAMADPYFAKSLTYICEHNTEGALGVVVNRPIDMTLRTLFEQIGITLENSHIANASLYFGGPVQTDRGFVLHRPIGVWSSTLAIGAEVGLTTSKDILEAIGRGEGPSDFIVTLGYAGWGPGQLENEIFQNAWLNVPADPSVIFDLPWEDRLTGAMSLLGVDLSSLSEGAGHA